MILLFARLARTYSKTVGLLLVVEEVQTVVLFIRDEIAIPNLRGRKAQKYMRVVVILFIL
jgi:hypothetical protein